MKLITEVNESIKVLKEQHEGKPRFFIEGIFLQAEKKNRNGRVYPVGILRNEVDKYVGEFVEQKRAFGELGHPDGPTVNLERVSHMITELYEDGNNFIGKAKIMETPYGKIVGNLLSRVLNLVYHQGEWVLSKKKVERTLFKMTSLWLPLLILSLIHPHLMLS